MCRSLDDSWNTLSPNFQVYLNGSAPVVFPSQVRAQEVSSSLQDLITVGAGTGAVVIETKKCQIGDHCHGNPVAFSFPDFLDVSDN